LLQINMAVKRKKKFVPIVIVAKREKHIKRILLKGYQLAYQLMRECIGMMNICTSTLV
jgi:hypothetical protein